MPGYIFNHHDWEGSATGLQLVKMVNAVKHPTGHRLTLTPPPKKKKNNLAQMSIVPKLRNSALEE